MYTFIKELSIISVSVLFDMFRKERRNRQACEALTKTYDDSYRHEFTNYPSLKRAEICIRKAFADLNVREQLHVIYQKKLPHVFRLESVDEFLKTTPENNSFYFINNRINQHDWQAYLLTTNGAFISMKITVTESEVAAFPEILIYQILEKAYLFFHQKQIPNMHVAHSITLGKCVVTINGAICTSDDALKYVYAAHEAIHVKHHHSFIIPIAKSISLYMAYKMLDTFLSRLQIKYAPIYSYFSALLASIFFINPFLNKCREVDADISATQLGGKEIMIASQHEIAANFYHSNTWLDQLTSSHPAPLTRVSYLRRFGLHSTLNLPVNNDIDETHVIDVAVETKTMRFAF